MSVPKRRLYLFLIAAAALAAYSSSFSGRFHMDDAQNIVENPRIRRLSRPDRIVTGTFRPVADLTLAANYAAGRLDVRGYHAVNLGIHALAALALRVKPDEAITHNNIGALLFQAGQVEEAAAWFRRAAELDPHDSGLRQGLLQVESALRGSRP